jgi:hypothetical protein
VNNIDVPTRTTKRQPQVIAPIIEGEHNNTLNVEPLIIPENCSVCGFPNFNIWGVKQNTKLEIKITCMKCGKTNQKIILNGFTN